MDNPAWMAEPVDTGINTDDLLEVSVASVPDPVPKPKKNVSFKADIEDDGK